MAFSVITISGGDMFHKFSTRATFGVLAGVLGIVIGNLAVIAAERIQLPEGPNRQFVAQTCQACHDLDMVIGLAGAERDIWDGTIEQMISYGLNVTPQERTMLLDYLATYLGPNKSPQQTLPVHDQFHRTGR